MALCSKCGKVTHNKPTIRGLCSECHDEAIRDFEESLDNIVSFCTAGLTCEGCILAEATKDRDCPVLDLADFKEQQAY